MTTCTEAKGLVAFPSRAAWKQQDQLKANLTVPLDRGERSSTLDVLSRFPEENLKKEPRGGGGGGKDVLGGGTGKNGVMLTRPV
jgi:hypothetical protein